MGLPDTPDPFGCRSGSLREFGDEPGSPMPTSCPCSFQPSHAGLRMRGRTLALSRSRPPSRRRSHAGRTLDDLTVRIGLCSLSPSQRSPTTPRSVDPTGCPRLILAWAHSRPGMIGNRLFEGQAAEKIGRTRGGLGETGPCPGKITGARETRSGNKPGGRLNNQSCW